MKSEWCDGLNGDEVVQIRRLSGWENFLSESPEFVRLLDAFISFKPLKKLQFIGMI